MGLTRHRISGTGLGLLVALAIGSSQSASAFFDGQIVVRETSTTIDVGGLPGLIGMDGSSKPMDIGSGIIVGRVVESDGRTPVQGTIVSLSQAGFAPLRVLTDGQGRFAFRALPPGSFSLTATRPGFVDGAHGRTHPGGAPQMVELTAEDSTSSAELMVWRHAAITGTVLDENNEPLVGAPVRALRRDYTSGRRRLTDAGSDSTDDRGQFRISALEPGEYVIALPMTQRPSLDAMMQRAREGARISGGGGAVNMFAVRVESSGGGGGAPMVITSSSGDSIPPAGTNAAGQPLTYQTEYFTGALAASRATPVAVVAGEERVGVDFRLTPVLALSLSGIVIGPDGPTPNTDLQLIPADAGDVVSPIETATATTDENGQFEFTGIPSGQYTLRAQRTPRLSVGREDFSFSSAGGETVRMVTRAVTVRGGSAPLPTEPTLWAETNVGVGTQALAGLTISLREGLTVSGQVSFQGAAAQPTPDARGGISISLEPADGRTADLTSVARGRVDPNGSFTTMGVPAGKYILRVSNAPQGWTLRSATFGGRDITETAVELASTNAAGVVLSFTDRPSEVSGTVRDASGNPAPGASILVFPVERTAWVDTGSQPRRLKTSRTGKEGNFRIGPLPPGEYHVVAIEDSVPRSWQNPDYLDAIARSATVVRIGEGDARVVTLVATKGPA